MRFPSLIALIAGIFLFNISVQAQTANEIIDLSIESIPANPAPGTTVNLMATSFAVDLNQMNLVWNYEGKVISSGVGQRSVFVTAPASGVAQMVTVTASGQNYAPVSASLILRPGSVDLLWEAVNAHVPPFYKGKPLLSRNGVFEVSAIPAVASAKNASFIWSRNNTVIPQVSGSGKSSVIFLNETLNNRENISVEVSSGPFQGQGSISINPRNPLILAYPRKEGFIDYATGFFDAIAFSGSGAVLRFEPYYFSTPRSLSRDLVFDVKLGEQSLFEDPVNEVQFAKPEGEGETRLTVDVTTAEYSLQNARRIFTLIFSQ